jgi:SAM-dependent methyltransferase
MFGERKNSIETHREKAREIALKHIEAGDPLGWFEVLYARAHGDASIIPWADLAPNPNLVDLLDANRIRGKGRKALKVRCGLGDDAEELARRGFKTTAFDISRTAISWCRHRYPPSPVEYLAADLYNAPTEWQGAFSLVVESYTLQVLPPDLRLKAIQCITGFLLPGGTLLVIIRGRDSTEPQGNMPWQLTREKLTAFNDSGLKEASFEDYFDEEDPPVRRFRAVYRRET